MTDKPRWDIECSAEGNDLQMDITLHGMGAIVVPSATGPKATVTYPRVVEDTPERKVTQLSENMTLITDSYREPEKKGDVWDALVDNEAERQDLRIRSRLVRALSRWIKSTGQNEETICLQLRISHNQLHAILQGHIDKFSMGGLLELCSAAGITKLDEYL